MSSFFYLTAFFCFLADQISKTLAARFLPPGSSVSILPNVLWFTQLHNRGAAFNLFQNQTLFLTLVGCLAVIMILWIQRKTPPSQVKTRLGLGMILGGSLGNLLDRVRFGYVVDFIDLKWWPVFNLADTLINVGIFFIILDLLFTHSDNTKPQTQYKNSGDY